MSKHGRFQLFSIAVPAVLIPAFLAVPVVPAVPIPAALAIPAVPVVPIPAFLQFYVVPAVLAVLCSSGTEKNCKTA